jgi:hypothetical protein
LIRNNALIYELFLEAFNSKKKLSPKLEWLNITKSEYTGGGITYDKKK